MGDRLERLAGAILVPRPGRREPVLALEPDRQFIHVANIARREVAAVEEPALEPDLCGGTVDDGDAEAVGFTSPNSPSANGWGIGWSTRPPCCCTVATAAVRSTTRRLIESHAAPSGPRGWVVRRGVLSTQGLIERCHVGTLVARMSPTRASIAWRDTPSVVLMPWLPVWWNQCNSNGLL